MAKDRQTVIVGNWKMYKTIAEAMDFIRQLIPFVEKSDSSIYLAVPFTAIQQAKEAVKDSKILIGAQNMNDASEGAFTGEVAAKMLKEAGAEFVILGHSERRRIFNEDNAFVNRKVMRAFEEGLQPILCVGETLEEREQKKTEEILESQIQGSLEGVSKEQMANLLLAYEPVWAIGTGETATPQMAEEAHQFCREVIAKKWDKAVAESLSILYGGSVKPENCKALLDQSDIDGLLVGGASLSVESFQQIVNYQTLTSKVST